MSRRDIVLSGLVVAIGAPCVVLLGWIVYAVGNPSSYATSALVALLKSSPF